MGTKKTIRYSLIVLLLGCIFLPKFFTPISQLDGAWYYSQAVSIANGSPNLNTYTNISTPLLYGWLQVPFALVFKPQLGILVFYALFTLCLGFIVVKQKQFAMGGILLALALITDKSLLIHRPEPVLFTLSLIAYFTLKKYNAKPIFYIVLGTLGILMHPVNGILIILAYLVFENKLFILLQKYWIAAVTAIITTIVFMVLKTESVLVQNLVHRLEIISIKPFLKFVSYSFPMIILVGYWSRKFWTSERIVPFVLLFVACFILGGWYYFIFMLLPLVLHILQNSESINLRFAGGIIIASTLISVVHPAYSFIENQEYKNNAAKIVSSLEKFATLIQYQADNKLVEDDPKIFIENHFAPAIYEHEFCKMMLIDKNQVLVMDSLRKGDFIVFTNQNHLKRFTEKYNIKQDPITAVEPVKGKLSLTSLYQNRTDSLGSWAITFE